MAKILDSQKLDFSIPKLLELNDEFVINGSVYDKTDLIPKPMTFIGTNSVLNKNILKYMHHTRTSAAWTYGGDTCYNSVEIDINDPFTTYVIANNSVYNCSTSYFYKIIRKNNETSIYTIDLGGTYNALYSIIGQSKDKVFIILNRNYSPGSNGFFYYFDKKTNILVSGPTIPSCYGNCIKVLKETDLYIYMINRGDARTIITKYNKSDNTINIIYDYTEKNYPWNFMCDYSDLTDKNEVYGMIDQIDLNKNYHNVQIVKYTIDFISNKVERKEFDMDLSLIKKENIPFYLPHVDYINNMFRVVEVNNKKYLLHNIITTTGSSGLTIDNNYFKFYLYEIDEENNRLILKSQTDTNGVSYQGCLFTNDNKTLICIYLNGVDFYSLNESSLSFKKTNSYLGSISNVGLDENNNIYVQDMDSSVEMISVAMGLNCVAKFAQKNYNYQGVDISSNLEVYVENFKGKLLNSQIELWLTGPVCFSDGTKKKNISTSNLNITQVPIIIKGQGLLKINFNFL